MRLIGKPLERWHIILTHAKWAFDLKPASIKNQSIWAAAGPILCGDEPDRIDAEKASRIAKLLYYLGTEIGNADERPQWNPESYARIVSDDRSLK